MGLTRTSSPSEIFSVLMCCMHVVFLCFIFVVHEIVRVCVVFLLYAGCKKTKNRKTKNDVLYFSAHGTRTGIIVLYFSARGTRSSIIVFYFSHMEENMVLLCYIFRVWNALWCYCVIFLRVERDLALLCYILRAWNAVWYFVIYSSACVTHSGVIVLCFSACGTHSGIIVLYFPRVKRALELLCCFFCACNALWHYCVIFSAHGRRSGVIVSYFPRVERALALLCYILRA